MCSLVLARIALCASLSLALFLASCDGVKVETLRVPFRLVGLLGSADGDRVIVVVESLGEAVGELNCEVEDKEDEDEL